MSWIDLLDNQITYKLIFEAFVAFTIFGGLLGVFWILGEVPWLQFSLDTFLDEYGLVFFLGLIIYRAARNVYMIAAQGM